MKELRTTDYLLHIQHTTQLACADVDGFEKQNFLADMRTQQAVVMNLIIIGEAAAKLLQTAGDFLEKHPKIHWKSMRGMRNRIAHGYFEINLETALCGKL